MKSRSLQVGLLISLGVALTATNSVLAQASKEWTDIQKEVLAAVEARNQAWADGDFESFMSLTHDRWLRWSMTSAGLMKKEDYARFWDDIKSDEEIVSMSVDPVAIEVFGDAAVAHYVTTEELIWTGDPEQIGDADLGPGDEFDARLRWSDFWIKQNGRWMVVGGHRDKTCLLRDDVNERPDEICSE